MWAMSEDKPRDLTAYLSFDVAGALYALPVDALREVVRMPRVVPVPQGPPSLDGIANLRGRVLPVVRASRLLRKPDSDRSEATRVLVLERGGLVGLGVDRLGALLTAGAMQREATDEEGLVAVLATAHGPVRVPDLDRLLAADFQPRARAARPISVAKERHAGRNTFSADQVALVGFALAERDYALPLGEVREILTLPEDIAVLPRSGSGALGVTTLRGQLLPILSGRALLGLPVEDAGGARPRIVVTSIGGMPAGIAVDWTTAIFRIPAADVDPVPPVLTRAAGGKAEVQSIARIEGGQRLVAVLSAERLLRHEGLARTTAEGKEQAMTQAREEREPIAVFTLADVEYGLPVAAVEEVARMPEALSRLPRAPRFVEGLISLRGRALPVIDLRRRLELPSPPRTGRERVLVIAVGGTRAGLLVDAVREIARLQLSAIEPAPEVAEGQASVVTRVANLAESGRMILLLDPARLLEGSEVRALARIGDRTGPLAP